MAVGEWDERQLCGDGACVGVIGPDGTCKVCGRAAPNWGDERTRGLITTDGDGEDDDDLADDEDDGDGEEYEDEDDDGDDVDEDEDEDAREDRVSVASEGAPPIWTERQLCPDGACIGVIGADGRCKMCGRTTPSGAGLDTASPSNASEATSSTADAAASPVIALRPCSDVACTGVSGSDGRCTECGKLVA